MNPPAAAFDFDLVLRRGDLRIAAAGDVRPGACLALFGPSGAGKSSILAVLAGLVPIDAGHVRFGARTLSARQPGKRLVAVALRDRRVGLLSQRPALFPHLDARANIGYGVPLDRRAARIAELADAMELDHRSLGTHPGQLSGGQAQRVALARALAPGPDLLLLDEPFTALDRPLAERIARVVAHERVRTAMACLLVTHALGEAQRWADDVLVLDRGQLLQRSPAADLVRHPASRRVAELVGYGAFVSPDVCLGTPHGPSAPPPPGTVAMALHPGSVTIAPPRAPDHAPGASPCVSPPVALPVAPPVEISADVRVVGADGGGFLVTLDLPDSAALHIWQPSGSAVPQPGDPVQLAVAGPPCFDRAGRFVGHWGSSTLSQGAHEPLSGTDRGSELS